MSLNQTQLDKLMDFIDATIEEHTTRTQYAIRGNQPPLDVGHTATRAREAVYEAFNLELPVPVDDQ